jgi:hypothetical protein
MAKQIITQLALFAAFAALRSEGGKVASNPGIASLAGARPVTAFAGASTLRAAAASDAAPSVPQLSDDVDTVRQRMLEAFGWPASWASSPPALAAAATEARALAAALLPNCTWPDVDYNDPQDRTIWGTAVHSQRVQLMAAVLSRAGSPAYNEDGLFDKARCALGAWFENDWFNENWWWYLLQTPQTIATSVLMLDTLPPAAGRASFPSADELAAALKITFRAAWWNSSLGYIVTGANLAWMVQAQLLRGAWPSLPNASALDGGFARLWQEVKIVHWIPSCDIDGACNGTNQGIQVDTSWHFHGAQLQTSQYGQDYLSDELEFMAVADGTRFALDAQRAQVLCAYVAGGFAWAAAGRGMDWSTAGRALDRNTWSAVSELSVNATLLQLLAARCTAPEEQAIVLRLAAAAGGKSSAPSVEGHRHYWTSDWASHKRPGWHATWRGLSNRTQTNECGNGENLLGMYEAQGLLNIVAEGDGVCVAGPNGTSGVMKQGPLGWGCGLEYAGVFPLLDWSALNGATALVDLPEPPCGTAKQCCWTADVRAARKPFVGGVSDGVYGATAMDAAFLTLSAHKAVFFFDSAIVALGADVSESSGATRVRTALASRFLRADAARTGLVLGFANGTARAFAADSNATAVNASALALRYAFADGVGYVILPATDGGALPPAHVWAGPREEPWARIGCFPGTMSGNTLSISIEQQAPGAAGGVGGAGGDVAASGGAVPLANASYAYVVVPNTTAAVMARIAANLGVLGLDPAGLVNSPTLQAAVQANSSDLVAQAVFWAPGSYAYSGSAWALELSVNAPCLLSYHETRGASGAASTVVLAASSPDAVDLALSVSMPLRPGCAAVVVALNPSALGDDWLGKSEVLLLSCPPAPACCSLVAGVGAGVGANAKDATTVTIEQVLPAAAVGSPAAAAAGVAAAAPPTPAPTPTAALSLFVGFPTGSCEPRGGDHPGAALYAASFSLGGKGGCGGKTPKWTLSPPGPQFTLATSQLAGVTNTLGTDPSSGHSWGTWLLGQPGGGPPYRQMVTQMTGGAAPSVDWTCRPPRGAYGVPFFDKRVARASPIYYSNGSFVVYGDPAARDTDNEEDESWVLGGQWDREADEGNGEGEDDHSAWRGDGAGLPAELARLARGTFIANDAERGAAGAGSSARAHAGRSRVGASPEDAPNCTLKKLGAYVLPAPGVERALIFDATYSSPSAVTLTLAGRTVTVQRLSLVTGKPLSQPHAINCAKCDQYLYAPTVVSNGVVIFSTINYTTSVITTFSGALNGASFAPIAGSQAFVLRESTVLALPTPAGGKGGGATPYPLGLAALQFSSINTTSWACNNASEMRPVRVGSVARAGAPMALLRTCSVPLCALPTDDGGCIVPMTGFE